MFNLLPLMAGTALKPTYDWELRYEFLDDYEDFIEDGMWPFHFEKGLNLAEMHILNAGYSNGMVWPPMGDFQAVISYPNLVDQPYWYTSQLAEFGTDPGFVRAGMEMTYHHTYLEDPTILLNNVLVLAQLGHIGGEYVYQLQRVRGQEDYYFRLKVRTSSGDEVEVFSEPRKFVSDQRIDTTLKVTLTKTGCKLVVNNTEVYDLPIPAGEVLRPADSLNYRFMDHTANSDENYGAELTACTRIYLYGDRT